jgi:hypothetical protein
MRQGEVTWQTSPSSATQAPDERTSMTQHPDEHFPNEQRRST